MTRLTVDDKRKILVSGRLFVVRVGSAAAVRPGVVVLDLRELDLRTVTFAGDLVSRRLRVKSSPRHSRSRTAKQPTSSLRPLWVTGLA